MRAFECWVTRIHRSFIFEKFEGIRNLFRPLYDRLVIYFGKNGLERNINGTDSILILPQLRHVGETYEIPVWKHLMSNVKAGDTVADVGAYIGIYTVALAKRVGPSGKVVAFEPEKQNFKYLSAHVALNQVSDRVKLLKAAVGAEKASLYFKSGEEAMSHVAADVSEPGLEKTTVMSLDDVFPSEAVGIIKIDTEGYEENVLKGAARLLSDSKRKPRIIYVEVHPYAWAPVGTASESLLGLLRGYGYRIIFPDGRPVEAISRYCEIIAIHEQVR